jgi:hypothetical protein
LSSTLRTKALTEEQSKNLIDLNKKKSLEVEWAYPSPYDKDLPIKRFIDASQLKRQVSIWDLNGLLNIWENSEEQESWPWVWTWHNSVGPHHVFIQLNKYTLQHTKRISDESERNNSTLVVKSIEDLKVFNLTPEMFYENRCAIIEGVILHQLDSENKILMLMRELYVMIIYIYSHMIFNLAYLL